MLDWYNTLSTFHSFLFWFLIWYSKPMLKLFYNFPFVISYYISKFFVLVSDLIFKAYMKFWLIWVAHCKACLRITLSTWFFFILNARTQTPLIKSETVSPLYFYPCWLHSIIVNLWIFWSIKLKPIWHYISYLIIGIIILIIIHNWWIVIIFFTFNFVIK